MIMGYFHRCTGLLNENVDEKKARHQGTGGRAKLDHTI